MAENDIESLISAAKRKRGANWSSEEQIILIEEVLKYEDKLFGKMKGAGAKGKMAKLKKRLGSPSLTDSIRKYSKASLLTYPKHGCCFADEFHHYLPLK